MDSSSSIHNLSSSLRCELRMIRANHLDFIPPGDIFIRCYLSTGTGKRIRLNSREIPSTCDPCWNQSFTLECHSSATSSLEELRRQSVVFELRWRCSFPILDRIVGSKLLGRSEIAWRDVLQSADGSIERCIPITTTSCPLVGLKPPSLQVGLRVGALEKVERRVVRLKNWNQCGCGDGGCNYRDEEDIFAIAAAMETL